MVTKFWEIVLEEIKSRGISRKELASATGIPYNTIVGYSAKSIDPSLENALKISEYLDLSVEYLSTNSDSGLPKDIYLIAKKLTDLTIEQRAPLIFMVDQQIEYWKKVYIDGNSPKLPDK